MDYLFVHFVTPERKQDKLLIDFYDYTENSLFDMIKEFDKDDKYTTALVSTCNSGRKQKTKDYQEWVTHEMDMIGLGHLKAVCFSPWEKVTRNKVRTRMECSMFYHIHYHTRISERCLEENQSIKILEKNHNNA